MSKELCLLMSEEHKTLYHEYCSKFISEPVINNVVVNDTYNLIFISVVTGFIIWFFIMAMNEKYVTRLFKTFYEILFITAIVMLITYIAHVTGNYSDDAWIMILSLFSVGILFFILHKVLYKSVDDMKTYYSYNDLINDPYIFYKVFINKSNAAKPSSGAKIITEYECKIVYNDRYNTHMFGTVYKTKEFNRVTGDTNKSYRCYDDNILLNKEDFEKLFKRKEK